MTRLGIVLLWLLYRLLPVAALAWLGERLGSLLYYLVRGRRHIGEVNLRLCFPDMPEPDRRRLLQAHFRAIGRASLLETLSWWGSRAEIAAVVRVEGLEHVEAHAGKPIILFSMHFVGLNLGGVRLTTMQDRCVTLYSTIRNPVFHKLMLRARTRFGEQLLYSRGDGIKPVLRAIKQGRPFYYLPDLDYGRKDALFLPFFGVPAATVTGLSRLAKATGAAVVPMVTAWREDEGGRGYVLRFHPAWMDFPSGDVEADTRRQNAFIEDRIREMPEQYFWLHKRFKTRPKREDPSFYV